MNSNHKLNVSNSNFKLGFDRRMRVYPIPTETKIISKEEVDETAKRNNDEEEKVSS